MSPTLYSLYVSGYWGLWSLCELAHGFSGRTILKAVVLVFLGYVFLRSFYRLTQLGRKVDRVLKVGEKYSGGGIA